MKIIAVAGIPPRASIRHVVKFIARFIKFDFEALNFDPNMKGKTKIFYFRLPENQAPWECIKAITGQVLNHRVLKAYIPTNVPNLPVSKNPKTVTQRLCSTYNVPIECTKAKMLSQASNALLFELYEIYPGLEYLGDKTKRSLVYELFNVIQTRIKEIQESQTIAKSSRRLTRDYRRTYPHDTDAKLVEGCLRAAADGEHIEFIEDMLMFQPYPGKSQAILEKTSLKTVHDACAVYSRQASEEILKYIDSLNIVVDKNLTEEEKGQLIVRSELKKMSPYIGEMLKKSVMDHFVLNKKIKVTVFGIPSLPTRKKVGDFVRRFSGTHSFHVDLYNCVHVEVDRGNLRAILEESGTTLHKSKLVVKMFVQRNYKKLLSEVFAVRQSLVGEKDLFNEEEWEEIDMNSPVGMEDHDDEDSS